MFNSQRRSSRLALRHNNSTTTMHWLLATTGTTTKVPRTAAGEATIRIGALVCMENTFIALLQLTTTTSSSLTTIIIIITLVVMVVVVRCRLLLASAIKFLAVPYLEEATLSHRQCNNNVWAVDTVTPTPCPIRARLPDMRRLQAQQPGHQLARLPLGTP